MPSTLPVVLLSGGAVIDLDGSLLIQLLIFAVAFEMMRRLIFRPMIAVFDAREAAIDGAKREARAIEGGADEKLKAFESEMKRVRTEAAADRDALRQDANRLERELIAKARAEADGMLADASTKIRTEADAIRADMKTRVPVLAGQIAEKLLGRKAA
jgi:F-type H+-transporting ATPase subunit b